MFDLIVAIKSMQFKKEVISDGPVQFVDGNNQSVQLIYRPVTDKDKAMCPRRWRDATTRGAQHGHVILGEQTASNIQLNDF